MFTKKMSKQNKTKRTTTKNRKKKRKRSRGSKTERKGIGVFIQFQSSSFEHRKSENVVFLVGFGQWGAAVGN